MFNAVEKNRLETGMSRSQYFRKAVEEYLRREEERELEEQYIKGYLNHPETPEEMEWVHQAGLEVLAKGPWEEEDEEAVFVDRSPVSIGRSYRQSIWPYDSHWDCRQHAGYPTFKSIVEGALP